jgi:hypothetical protein
MTGVISLAGRLSGELHHRWYNLCWGYYNLILPAVSQIVKMTCVQSLGQFQVQVDVGGVDFKPDIFFCRYENPPTE